MKRPTKPPPPPAPPVPDGPSSGRARKDVNYLPSSSMPTAAPVPPRSVSPVRPPLPLPSSRTPPADEYEMMEDMATPMRHPGPAIEPTTGPAAPPSVRDLAAHWDGGAGGGAPFATGPMQPLPMPMPMPMPMPPPSSRGPANYGPPSQQPMQAASSGRVRQVSPMDAPPYSSGGYPSQQGPISGQQITGPQMPLMQRPGSGGSYPSQPSVPSSARRPSADDGVPLGYVVASAFFLAIALVGFGLYLAFEVF